ncbi:PfkB family carbohydrate kinase [Pseudoduganella sp. RAF53_2]|uniref:PfkB family carbohydrate kinase n=1 Tax=unclassified Pseudoduganella TaxID=2637179 RepID=UPI003F987248
MSERILVFGEALLDDFGTEQVAGGAPFNLARTLAAFGQPQLMVTRVGRDAGGETIRDEFTRFGMSPEGIQSDPARPTGRVHVTRGEDGVPHYDILPDQAYDHLEGVLALDVLRAYSPDTICFGTLAQRSATSCHALAALLDASPAERFFDLNLRDGWVDESIVFTSLQQADILKVNEQELQTLFSWYCHTCPGTDKMDCVVLESECRSLMHNFSLKGMLVTLGARGAMYFGADGTAAHSHDVRAPAKLVDTVGAGDAFSAVFLLGRAHGWEILATLNRANEFAGAICGIAGAVPQDLNFYKPWREAWGLA